MSGARSAPPPNRSAFPAPGRSRPAPARNPPRGAPAPVWHRALRRRRCRRRHPISTAETGPTPRATPRPEAVPPHEAGSPLALEQLEVAAGERTGRLPSGCRQRTSRGHRAQESAKRPRRTPGAPGSGARAVGQYLDRSDDGKHRAVGRGAGRQLRHGMLQRHRSSRPAAVRPSVRRSAPRSRCAWPDTRSPPRRNHDRCGSRCHRACR